MAKTQSEPPSRAYGSPTQRKGLVFRDMRLQYEDSPAGKKKENSMEYGKGKEPSLKGKGGKDKGAYSDMGGAAVKQVKQDKLAGKCGSDCKSKDSSAYSSAGLSDSKKQAGA